MTQVRTREKIQAGGGVRAPRDAASAQLRQLPLNPVPRRWIGG